MTKLIDKQCTPCHSDVAALSDYLRDHYFNELSDEWMLVGKNKLQRVYLFKNFKECLVFINKIGDIAEQEGHHPNIEMSWGRVVLIIYTHNINDLTENDFILAAKCEAII